MPRHLNHLICRGNVDAVEVDVQGAGVSDEVQPLTHI